GVINARLSGSSRMLLGRLTGAGSGRVGAIVDPLSLRNNDSKLSGRPGTLSRMDEAPADEALSEAAGGAFVSGCASAARDGSASRTASAMLPASRRELELQAVMPGATVSQTVRGVKASFGSLHRFSGSFLPAAPARIRAEAALCCSGKFNQDPRPAAGEQSLRLIQCLAKGPVSPEQQAIQLLQFEPLVRREAGPPQSHDVQPADAIHLVSQGERRNILAHRGAPLHHRQRPHPHKLMNQAIAGQKRAVLNDGMPAE